MAVTIEDAIAVIVDEAEKHEKEQQVEFCEDIRVNLVVFAMLHLGLGLIDLGLVAEQLAKALAINEKHLADEDEGNWPILINDPHN